MSNNSDSEWAAVVCIEKMEDVAKTINVDFFELLAEIVSISLLSNDNCKCHTHWLELFNRVEQKREEFYKTLGSKIEGKSRDVFM